MESEDAKIVKTKISVNRNSAQIWSERLSILSSLLATFFSTECQLYLYGKTFAIYLQMSTRMQFWAQFCLNYDWIIGNIQKILSYMSTITTYTTVWPVCSCIAFICCPPQMPVWEWI